ncbi:integration host factor subunit alpha [Novosphingobium kaempferiae]|uniref:integration host factor subunit alpha n=1 Tax=Novosphingobium kaempferiae TaxID=2896849 RepID=UPI001E50BBCD|nr:integration host factor subunit alpha [Novosphingobium kaempferiae]
MAAAISRRVGISIRDASFMVDAILEEMAAALERGENVKITNFGTFLLNDKAPRIGRNPKTGQEALVSARRVVTFNPGMGLRARVAPIPD